MSGSLAARYIAGLPYDPSMGVGQYSRAPRGAAPQPGQVQGGALRVTDATGQAVRVPAGTATVGTGAADIGGGDMLLAAALGLLPYLPDAYNFAQRQLTGEPAQQAQAAPSAGIDAPLAAGQIPAGAAIQPGQSLILRNGQTFQAPAGASMDIDGIVNLPGGGFEELSPWEAGPSGFSDLPMAPIDGGAPVGAAPVEGATPGAGGWLQNPLGLPAEAMTVSDMGLGTVGGVDVANSLAYAPAAVFAMGTPAFAKPGGELGGQIGTGIGTAIGGLIGGPWGAAAGAIAGGAIGGQIGPAPTVGRNFSTMGTFTGDGGIAWGQSGGDNGGSAADADPFASWFASDLSRQAAAQGLGFNPNMAGAQIRVGGYDNFSRTHPSPAGGYFYDITNQGGSFGGSPENYALRPSDAFASDPFSRNQADAFTTNVLADLTARGVYTPGGAATGGQGDLMGTLGANYGYYGPTGSDYSTIAYGGNGGFSDILTGRRNEITGYQNAAPWRAYESAVAQMPGVPGEGEQAGPAGPTPYWNGSALAWAQPTAPVEMPYDPGGA